MLKLADQGGTVHLVHLCSQVRLELTEAWHDLGFVCYTMHHE